MGTLSGEATAEIDAPIERCWALVEDVSIAPEWQRGLEEMNVIERDAQGRGAICNSVIDGKIRLFHSRVRFSYDGPMKLAWEQLHGDLKSMRGSWDLADLGDGRTRATYRLELDPGRLGLLIRGPVEASVRAVIVGARPVELATRLAVAPST
jgi:ribosome-associated toxin RatA of RatAB toxin-antitoxin module